MEGRERVAIQLVRDTRTRPLPIGVRQVVQRTRHLLFESEPFEVVLQVCPDASDERLQLMGEVLSQGTPVSAAAVRLTGPLSPVEQVTDGEGEFWLEALPKGGYAIEVDTANHVIEIPALSLAE